jgi:DeoR/GlpR family transcriptional regulator of sugar metabolism
VAKLPVERKQHLLDYLTQHEFADVASLARAVQASPATIRRDLQDLADKAIITRTRGGAALTARGVGHEPPYLARAKENLTEKRAIARVAATLIREGEVIALDVGTTTLELAKMIRERRNLTVFTASLPIAQVLAQSDVSVILVGGVLRKRELSLSGTLAIQMVSQFHFDKVFLGTAGITVNDGFTDFGMDDVDVKKAFLARCKQVIALADHTKLGQVSLVTTCPISAVSTLITDSQADSALLNELRQAGLQILVAANGNSIAARFDNGRN